VIEIAYTKSGEEIALIPEGTRIRHKRLPHLTGYIKAHEWSGPGTISAIPYLIGWDDSEAAARELGWLFVYAGNESIEVIA
jgi:hypothetical protein